MEDNKKEVVVTARGSLGLLALGSVGVRLWREAVKKKVAEKKKNKKKDE